MTQNGNRGSNQSVCRSVFRLIMPLFLTILLSITWGPSIFGGDEEVNVSKVIHGEYNGQGYRSTELKVTDDDTETIQEKNYQSSHRPLRGTDGRVMLPEVLEPGSAIRVYADPAFVSNRDGTSNIWLINLT